MIYDFFYFNIAVYWMLKGKFNTIASSIYIQGASQKNQCYCFHRERKISRINDFYAYTFGEQ